MRRLAVGGWLLAVTLASGQGELLQNPGLEGDYRGLAAGWSDNLWGQPRPAVTFSRELVDRREGQAAQAVEVSALPPGSGVILRQMHTFQAGRTYRARVWLRGDPGLRVTVQLRRSGQWYDSAAIRLVTLTPQWQEVVIRGGWGEEVSGFLGVAARGVGRFWVDAASLTDVSPETTATAPPTAVIPPEFWGLHLNKLGSHNVWPDLGCGLLRLWDSGTTWAHLQPEPTRWNWTRLDYYVRHVETHAPGTAILLTLGIPPAWAAPPGGREIYGGTTLPPRELETWRAYVRTVAERFRGRIRYWEIWNECDVNVFFGGTPAQMLELARAAREELRAVDPANVVLTPNVTRTGLAWLAEYLALGGGELADVISIHRYPSPRPEDDLPEYVGVQDLLAAHGLGGKPLWNTEGALSTALPGGDAAAPGAVARGWLTQWCQGLAQFSWYCWDIHWPGANLSQTLTGAAVTPAGAALRELRGWLRGAAVTGRQVDGPLWTVAIRLPSGPAHLLWTTGEPLERPLPPAWAATRWRRLDGRQGALTTTVQVTGEPLLVE